jgi:rSAM/selenodomain-associated transferase 1
VAGRQASTIEPARREARPACRPPRRREPPRRLPVAIVLFARVPRAGRVKTRLVPPLTPEQALTLHVALVARAARLVRRAARRAGARAFIAWSAPWTPPARGPAAVLARALRGFAARPQRGADLGTRMRAAIRHLLRRGHAAVVVFGSDAPLAGAGVLARAARALAAGTPAVIGPAADGGYYLIGLAADRPNLFAGIPWGTARVLGLTRARLRRARLRVLLLPRARDVDRPADLVWLRAALAGPRRRRAPALAAIVERLPGGRRARA